MRSARVIAFMLLAAVVEFQPLSANTPTGGTAAADWPMYGRDNLGTRTNTAEMTLSRASVSQRGLDVKWRFPTPGPVYGTPAVVGGRVYAADMHGGVYALDATTGLPVWTARVGPMATSSFVITSSPLITERYVVIGDHNGTYWALDRDTGVVAWMQRPNHFGFPAIWGSASLATVRASDGRRTLILAPVSANDHTIAATSQQPCCSARGSVAALDPETGAIVWQTFTISEAQAAQGSSGASIWVMPVYDPELNLVYVGTSNNYSAPATDTSDALIAMDAATGGIVWKNQFTEGDIWTIGNPIGPDADVGDSPAIFRLPNGRKVVAAGDKSGHMHVIDAKTGVLLSSTALVSGGRHGGLWESAQANGILFAPGNDWPDFTPFNSPPPVAGHVVAVRPNGSGQLKELWRFSRSGTGMTGAVAVANSVAYVLADREGVLYALDAARGDILDEVHLGIGLNGPSVSNGQVYVGLGDVTGIAGTEPGGAIVALGLAPGGGTH